VAYYRTLPIYGGECGSLHLRARAEYIKRKRARMSIEIKVSLGDIYILTTQDDRELALQEAMQTISNEYGSQLADSAKYTVEGEEK
jgi:hypothetical protein